jgi:hypothetical protein
MWEYAHKGLGRTTVLAGLINSSLGAYIFYTITPDAPLLPLPVIYAVLAVAVVAVWFLARLRPVFQNAPAAGPQE